MITDPPQISFTTLSKKRKEKEKKCDTWHVTRDMWHVTSDTWHMTCFGGWTSSQNFSSLALTVCDLWYYEDLEEKADWVTEIINLLINDKAVYRTAPATPGLLKTTWTFLRGHPPEASKSVIFQLPVVPTTDNWYSSSPIWTYRPRDLFDSLLSNFNLPSFWQCVPSPAVFLAYIKRCDDPWLCFRAFGDTPETIIRSKQFRSWRWFVCVFFLVILRSTPNFSCLAWFFSFLPLWQRSSSGIYVCLTKYSLLILSS